ncbi:response regulator [Candidatus Fermentibacteria bacterium]|nr:response regulator [Candidatus Fermentibacteria bacterium]
MIRILLVEDHPVVRRGLTSLLEEEPDMEVCGETGMAPEAERMAGELSPDLAIVDLSLAEGDGLELVKRLSARYDGIRILVSSIHDEKLYAERVLESGARGYLQKDAPQEELVNAVRTVHSGNVYLSDVMTDRLLRRFVGGKSDARGDQPLESRLTDRELEIMELIGEGVSSNSIAEKLSISVKTVESHRQNIKRKLNLKTNLELIRWSVRWVLQQKGEI